MSYQKPIIGNQGKDVHTRSFASGNPYGDYPGLGGAQFPAPYSGGMEGGAGGGGGLGGALGNLLGGGSGGGSGLNINQIKQFVDKMGGIEGIMTRMQQAQKMISMFQQMAPMAKLLFGSIAKGGSVKSESTDYDLDGLAPTGRRRRRRKRRGTGPVRGRRRRR
ncbi:hypothetical protein [Paenibacillus silviterrae]|uniref:hypothetical protein n=1 Tax=Paenibacillus silviterrae TaxID=3242194 RepID=UPI002542B872|nr:hypothetical protein [Paenibacillus chinjuensis]